MVTDRFPPETDGGAEISLHDTLAVIPREQFDIKVFALSAAGGRVRQDAVSGLPVLRVPFDPVWPQGLNDARARGSGRAGLLTAIAREAARRPSSAGRLAKFSTLRAFGPPEEFPGSEPDTLRAAPRVRHELSELINGWEPDLIHADNKDSILLASNVSRGGKPLVAFVRDHRFFCGHAQQSMTVADEACSTCAFGCVDNTGEPWRTWLEGAMRAATEFRQAALAEADIVATTSEYLVDEMARIGVADVQAIGVPHPDPKHFVPGHTHSRPTILFAGHLRREKGPLILADVFPTLQQSDVQVVMAGTGPLASEIASRAEQAGIADRVVLTGFLPRRRLYEHMSTASTIVAPSLLPEGFGRLALEAGIAGKPIVATALGGHLETIKDGVTGVLVPPADISALAEALTTVLESGASMGVAGRNHVLGKFAPSTVAQRLTNIWRQALGTDPQRGLAP